MMDLHFHEDWLPSNKMCACVYVHAQLCVFINPNFKTDFGAWSPQEITLPEIEFEG